MDDLAAVSDLARGRLELELERLELEPLLRESIASVSPQLALRRQELKLETALDPLPVAGDRRRLLQATARLLDHAARATIVGGVVTVSARSAGARALVRVSGSPGAPGGDKPTSERRLGLFLLRRLIALHGGALTEDTSEGAQGLPLVMELPLAAVAMPVPGRSPAAHQAGRPSRRVLVVDDEYDSAHALGMALERRGHQVHIVHNGKAALEALAVFRPDAVLMDIGLPGLDGLQVARAIRALPDQAHLTLIAATGLGWSDDRRRSLQAGFDHHLVKPLALEDVEAALARAPDGETTVVDRS
jgi:CheY-like chemotaxis protein